MQKLKRWRDPGHLLIPFVKYVDFLRSALESKLSKTSCSNNQTLLAMVWLVGDGDVDAGHIEFNLYPGVRAESPCVTCDPPAKESELADADETHIFTKDTFCCILVVVHELIKPY